MSTTPLRSPEPTPALGTEPMTTAPAAPSALPGGVKALLDLFAGPLQGVRFGDLDGAVLDEGAAQVDDRARAVSEAEAALDRARATLAESQEALLAKAQRALAHARIFAEDDADLAARLEAVVLARPAAPRRIAVEGSAAEPVAARRRARGKDSPAAPLFTPSAPPAQSLSPSVEAA